MIGRKSGNRVYKIQNPQKREQLIWGRVVVAWIREVSTAQCHSSEAPTRRKDNADLVQILPPLLNS